MDTPLYTPVNSPNRNLPWRHSARDLELLWVRVIAQAIIRTDTNPLDDYHAVVVRSDDGYDAVDMIVPDDHFQGARTGLSDLGACIAVRQALEQQVKGNYRHAAAVRATLNRIEMPPHLASRPRVLRYYRTLSWSVGELVLPKNT